MPGERIQSPRQRHPLPRAGRLEVRHRRLEWLLFVDDARHGATVPSAGADAAARQKDVAWDHPRPSDATTGRSGGPIELAVDKTWILRSEIGTGQPWSVRGSPKWGSTLLSKRVMPQILSPVRVRTSSPMAWRGPPPVARR